jgi:predicted NAD/FAD-binding protein
LYEKASKAGVGIYSVKVPNCNKTVDIPLRVFTPAYYPHLLELYARAGVVTEKTNHSAAYADENNRLFFHYGNLLLGGKSLSFPKHLPLIYYAFM